MYEEDVENMLINACQELGYKCLKSEKLTRGFPDRMVFIPNVGIHYVEIKLGSSYKQTKQQRYWQSIIERSQEAYFLITGAVEMQDYIDKHIKNKGLF